MHGILALIFFGGRLEDSFLEKLIKIATNYHLDFLSKEVISLLDFLK